MQDKEIGQIVLIDSNLRAWRIGERVQGHGAMGPYVQGRGEQGDSLGPRA